MCGPRSIVIYLAWTLPRGKGKWVPSNWVVCSHCPAPKKPVNAHTHTHPRGMRAQDACTNLPKDALPCTSSPLPPELIIFHICTWGFGLGLASLDSHGGPAWQNMGPFFVVPTRMRHLRETPLATESGQVVQTQFLVQTMVFPRSLMQVTWSVLVMLCVCEGVLFRLLVKENHRESHIGIALF